VLVASTFPLLVEWSVTFVPVLCVAANAAPATTSVTKTDALAILFRM
jgi:hypothetical protein